MALGLATGVIGQVVNTMAKLGGNNVLGIIMFVLVLLVGHTFNIAINTLGAYVHSSRLQYVEFFGKFYEDGVEYETADGQRHESRGYDSVILSMGFRNYNPFGEEIKAIVPDTYVIGDATRARRALDATKEAYEVASTL